MRYFFFFLFSILSYSLCAQKQLTGIITDEKEKPVPFASIFLSNTTTGTRSDEAGKFTLLLPNGKFDLVVSSIGYETYIKTIITSEVPEMLSIRLSFKTETMEAITIEPYEKDGWEKWGLFFVDNFIGTMSEARQCRILNKDVIKFRNSRKRNELNAYAAEPLVIENKALGYKVIYQLESFIYNFKTRELTYTGYPFFELLDASGTKEKKWEKNRASVYYGSMMHFMRSIYRNKILEYGFEVQRLWKIPNTEKARVRKIVQNYVSTHVKDGNHAIALTKMDSSAYYREILKGSDFTDVVSKNLLTGDSIAYAVNNTTAGLHFENYLVVTYKIKSAPYEFSQFSGGVKTMTSQITLINGRDVEIEPNGNYFYPTDLMSSGFWAWSEKIATLLPFDYTP